MLTRSTWIGFAVASILVAGLAYAADAPWTPERWSAEDTVKLCTTVPDEGLYCFPVWLVVLDGDVFVRLGSRAADRMRRNTTAPFLPVEIGGHRFERVRAVEVPDAVERVAKAMGEKYTSDVLVRFFSHPLTMRLKPD